MAHVSLHAVDRSISITIVGSKDIVALGFCCVCNERKLINEGITLCSRPKKREKVLHYEDGDFFDTCTWFNLLWKDNNFFVTI